LISLPDTASDDAERLRYFINACARLRHSAYGLQRKEDQNANYNGSNGEHGPLSLCDQDKSEALRAQNDDTKAMIAWMTSVINMVISIINHQRSPTSR
jgi:hypothetical protein